MRKLIFYLVVIALLSSCNTRDGNILHIEEQGSFAVGGTILTDSLGRNYHGDHASPDAATRDVALRPSPYHRFSMKKNGLTVSV